MSNYGPLIGSLVRVKKLYPDAIVPAYQTKGAAGMDLHVHRLLCDWGSKRRPVFLLDPMDRVLVGTGLSLAIPPGYEGQIRPRSGLALKQGITVLNSPGTIDSDYRGEVQVLLINLGKEPVEIKRGYRIAQLVIAPVVQATLREVEQLDETERGAGGFGSTGKSDEELLREFSQGAARGEYCESCGACAEVFFTGVTTANHEAECPGAAVKLQIT